MMQPDFEVIENTEQAKEEFGYNYGAEDKEITGEQLLDLLDGKCLATGIQGDEYSAFVYLADPVDLAPVIHSHWYGVLSDGTKVFIPTGYERTPFNGNNYTGDILCANCNHIAPGYPWWECDLEAAPYCPHCGAKMDERVTDFETI